MRISRRLIRLRVAEKKRELMPLEYARGVEDKAIGVVLQAMAGMAARCAGSDLQLRRKIYQVVYETRLKLATILNELVDEAGEPPLTPSTTDNTENDEEAQSHGR
jgi:hypothetical protein